MHNHDVEHDIVHVRDGHTAAADGPFKPFTVRVGHGERIALIGPDEATKAALFKLITGEWTCVHGQVRFKGVPVDEWTPTELSLCRAVLTHGATAKIRLQASMLIAIGRVGRVSDDRLEEIVLMAAQLAQVDHLLGRRVHTLSADEQARVQLARVFAQLWDVRHGLLVLDEPFAAVDPKLQSTMAEAVEHFVRTRAHTLIAAVQHVPHALLYFSRLLLVAQHRISADIPSSRHTLQVVQDIAARQARLPEVVGCGT